MQGPPCVALSELSFNDHFWDGIAKYNQATIGHGQCRSLERVFHAHVFLRLWGSPSALAKLWLGFLARDLAELEPDQITRAEKSGRPQIPKSVGPCSPLFVFGFSKSAIYLGWL